ncbi:MAG: DUF2812 domain-containing protein [Acidobacteriota bacterium]
MVKENREKEVKRVAKTFFIWSEKKEARWLNEMSKKGWHLKKASVLYYTFEKGEPGDFVYQFDFRFGSTKDEKEYIGLFEGAGWELINKQGAWYYFRKLYREGEQNEIYSDRESLKKKYRTILTFLFLVGLPLIFNFFTVFRSYGRSGFYKYFWPFNTIILILWIYAVIRIIIYMRSESGKYD